MTGRRRSRAAVVGLLLGVIVGGCTPATRTVAACHPSDRDGELTGVLQRFRAADADAPWSDTPTSSFANVFSPSTANELARHLDLPCSALRFQTTPSNELRLAAVAYGPDGMVAAIRPSDSTDIGPLDTWVELPGRGPVQGRHVDDATFVARLNSNEVLIFVSRGRPLDQGLAAYEERQSTVCDRDCVYELRAR